MIASTQTNHPLAGIKAAPERTVRPLDLAIARLKSAGLRITQPRIAILETLITRASPASIEQIHQDLSDDSCDLVTVYRCLAVFEELGLVHRCFFHNGTSLYEFSLGAAPRHHVVCKSCGKVEQIEFQLGEGAARLLQERGYTQLSAMVEFFGVCPDCQKKAPARGGLTAEQVGAASQA